MRRDGSGVRYAKAGGRAIAAIAILYGVSISSVQAAVLETTNITNRYEISFAAAGGGFGAFAAGTDASADLEDVYASGLPGGKSSLVYDSTSNGNGGFSYLHNVACSGYCSAFVETTVVSVITNDSLDDLLDLRFNTAITPGHLGFRATDADSQGSFDYAISRVGLGGTTLDQYYSAAGTLGPASDSFAIGGSQATTATAYGSEFAGLIKSVGDDQAAYDWAATSVSISLGALGAGQSMTVVIKSITSAATTAACDDLDACDSVQVVFGDPRNDGSVIARGDGSGTPKPTNPPAVGGSYDPSLVPTGFTYKVSRPSARSTAAPEPATWLTMICGFGIAGLALRRRRATALQAA